MEFNEKLRKLRRDQSLSQENLADMLGVSRQAISKWEAGQSFPDIGNLIQLSEMFKVTTDYLLICKEARNEEESEQKVESKEEAVYVKIPSGQIRHAGLWRYGMFAINREYKSKIKILGIPLVHINIGRGKRVAKGIVAVGNMAVGVVSVGGLTSGGISIGFLSAGAVSAGMLSLGLLSVGVVAVGAIAIGTIAVGYMATGAVAVGRYSLGAMAYARDVAIGDYAKGHVAAGRRAHGVKVLLDQRLSGVYSNGFLKAEEVQQLILSEFPNISAWVLKWLTSPF